MVKTDRTVSEITRQARRNALTLKGRSKVYRRVESWDEVNPGTKNEKFIVTLVPGWSFDEHSVVRVMEFKSIALAMRGVSLTYPHKLDVPSSEIEVYDFTVTDDTVIDVAPDMPVKELSLEDKLKTLCAIGKE